MLTPYLRDLFSDVTQLNNPLSQSTRAFSSMNGEALELARQARVAMQSGDQEEAVRLEAEATALMPKTKKATVKATVTKPKAKNGSATKKTTKA